MFLIKIELKIVLQTRGEPYTFRNFFFVQGYIFLGWFFFCEGLILGWLFAVLDIGLVVAIVVDFLQFSYGVPPIN